MIYPELDPIDIITHFTSIGWTVTIFRSDETYFAEARDPVDGVNAHEARGGTITQALDGLYRYWESMEEIRLELGLE